MNRTLVDLRGIALACLGVAIAARVSIDLPGSAVPQSLQTLAVVLAGAWLGARRGAAALLVYLGAGGLGLPVFADGAAGWAHLVGPSAGYLAGFVVAAALVGRARDARILVRPGPALLTMIGAHVVILLPGWGRLAGIVGAGEAWATGVEPFLVGGLLKAGVGALLAVAITPGLAHSTSRQPEPPPEEDHEDALLP